MKTVFQLNGSTYPRCSGSKMPGKKGNWVLRPGLKDDQGKTAAQANTRNLRGHCRVICNVGFFFSSAFLRYS